jgi:hypothetical protein
MRQDVLDAQALGDVAVQHHADELDARLAHDPGHTQIAVEDLVYTIERVLLVDQRVQQNAERPHVLFLATVARALEDLGRSIVCSGGVSGEMKEDRREVERGEAEREEERETYRWSRQRRQRDRS